MFVEVKAMKTKIKYKHFIMNYDYCYHLYHCQFTSLCQFLVQQLACPGHIFFDGFKLFYIGDKSVKLLFEYWLLQFYVLSKTFSCYSILLGTLISIFIIVFQCCFMWNWSFAFSVLFWFDSSDFVSFLPLFHFICNRIKNCFFFFSSNTTNRKLLWAFYELWPCQ